MIRLNPLGSANSQFKTYSCFKVAMSSFMRASNVSTSRRSAEVAVRIAADSFLVSIVVSVRSSDNAALNKYACYMEG